MISVPWNGLTAHRLKRSSGLLCCLIALQACEAPGAPLDATAHQAEIESWHQARLDDLLRPDGWLTLVGLFWLREGRTTFGSDSSNDIVYAGVGGDSAYGDGGLPDRIGTFILRGDVVDFKAEPGLEIRASGNPVASVVMDPRRIHEPVVLQWGPLSWLVIERDGRIALRLKDAQSPARFGFRGIERFPVDPSFRLLGTFQPYDPPRTIQVPNALGYVSELPSPGSVSFRWHGDDYRLDLWREPTDDPRDLFTVFGDATNGLETYGGGRFLWVREPEGTRRTVVDFNRAFNPPCVFTEFATCPIPPRQNRLSFRVEAGEKAYAKH